MIAARDLRVGDELRDEAGRLVFTIIEVRGVMQFTDNPLNCLVGYVTETPGGREVIREVPAGRLLPYTRPERTNA